MLIVMKEEERRRFRGQHLLIWIMRGIRLLWNSGRSFVSGLRTAHPMISSQSSRCTQRLRASRSIPIADMCGWDA